MVSVTLLFTLIFVGSELLIELGVNVREACDQNFVLGPIIHQENRVDTKEIDIALNAVLLDRMKFLDGALSYLPVGFPTNITNALCTSCLRKDFPSDNPSNVILEGCNITDYKQYGENELDIGIQRTEGEYKTQTVGFAEKDLNGNHKQCFCGPGDVTQAVKVHIKRYSTFLFSSKQETVNNVPKNSTCQCSSGNALDLESDGKQDGDILYFEYNDQSHIPGLLKRSQSDRNLKVFWTPIESTTNVQIISCKQNFISMKSFMKALFVLRYIQLEKRIIPREYNVTTGRFPTMTPEDIYNAGLSHKLAESSSIQDPTPIGRYRIYELCGTFDARYAIPTIVSATVILILRLVAVRTLNKSRRHENARILDSTDFEGTDLHRDSPGIPLYRIGKSPKTATIGAVVRSSKAKRSRPQKIVIVRDQRQNTGEVRIVPQGVIHMDPDQDEEYDRVIT